LWRCVLHVILNVERYALVYFDLVTGQFTKASGSARDFCVSSEPLILKKD